MGFGEFRGGGRGRQQLDQLPDVLAVFERPDIDGVFAGDDGDIIHAPTARCTPCVMTSELRVLTTVVFAAATLPLPSRAPDFQTASQLPISDHLKGEGTTAALEVFSMIA